MRRRALLAAAGTSLASLSGCLGAPEYTITDVTVTSTAPFEFDVTVVDPDAIVEHPAELEFEVRNESDRPLRVRNTGVWPFGLLQLVYSREESAAGTILWTERYETSQYVDAENRSSYGVESTSLVRALDAGDAVSETYELHGDGVHEAGTAYVIGEFESPVFEYQRDGDDDWTAFTPTIEVAITTKEWVSL